MLIDDRRHTAIHEAGHAVIGRLLGMLCGLVTIESDEDSSGHAIVADPWATLQMWENRGKYRDAKSVFRGRILAYTAGAEAEVECFGTCHGGDGDDRFHIERMLDDQWGHIKGRSYLAHYEARLRVHTRGLVRRRRSAIERVAALLLTQGTLAPPQIERAIKRGRQG